MKTFIPFKCWQYVFLLSLTACVATPAAADEKDELATALRIITQLQASLERARVGAIQASPEEQSRYFFDYQRAHADLNTISSGIAHYLEPSRAQPRDFTQVTGQYRRESP